MHPYVQAAVGGGLIGLASWLVLAGLGRVTGISGIACGVMGPQTPAVRWRWAFLVGLVAGGTLFGLWLEPSTLPERSPLLLLAAGLLVGYGTVRGSGCTSGHGVCGLGRRSVRSLVAVLTFMATAFATVFVMGQL